MCPPKGIPISIQPKRTCTRLNRASILVVTGTNIMSGGLSFASIPEFHNILVFLCHAWQVLHCDIVLPSPNHKLSYRISGSRGSMATDLRQAVLV